MGRVKKYLISIMTIALFSEMYFYPFQGMFRFSAGVLAISLVILIQEDLDESYLGFFTGVFVVALRTIVGSVNLNQSLSTSFNSVYPVFFYYTCFGIMSKLVALRENKNYYYKIIFSLFFVDVFSNIMELIFRDDMNAKIIRYTLVIAATRSIISYSIYVVFRNQELIILKNEHQKRYAQLNQIAANIQAETFYLKKSMKDIESVMSKSHMLYMQNRDDEKISELSLDIAREVHEIKKDYYRIILGLEGFIRDFEDNDEMSFKDIILIIRENIDRYIKDSGKSIDIFFIINSDISIKNYYYIFTILNNLIVNSIDATRKSGKIFVKQQIKEENLIISVKDTAGGIDEDLIDYIFNPGFTTKYDSLTGEPSTGIGLSHIKNITDSLKGNIEIENNKQEGVTFKISIPINSLKG